MRVVYTPGAPPRVVAQMSAETGRGIPSDYPVDALEAGLGLDRASLDAHLARGDAGTEVIARARIVLDAKEVRLHRNAVLVAPEGIAAMHTRATALRAHPIAPVRAAAQESEAWFVGLVPSATSPSSAPK